MGERDDRVQALLALYGRTYAKEIGFALRDTPQPLFRLLVASLLFSTRIDAGLAVAAAKALADAGWNDPQSLLDAGWEARTRVLNASGYARYDESTSRMLGETCELLLDRYMGDLRSLREEARREPAAERRLLKECKGLGDVAVDIFFREAQGAWSELFPFLDERAAGAARDLGLPGSAGALADLVPREDVPRLVTALVRVSLAGDADRVRAHARGEDIRDDQERLADTTKAELYERARKADIPERSTMSKDELGEALGPTGRRGRTGCGRASYRRRRATARWFAGRFITPLSLTPHHQPRTTKPRSIPR